jgi:hypothetical protein
VLVEEKSALQSQLRQAMQIANEKHSLNEQLEVGRKSIELEEKNFIRAD